VRQIIGPPLAQLHDAIHPFPRWDEREFDDDFGSMAEIVMTVCVLLFIISSFIWLVFVVMNWKHDAIKAASPAFLVVILFGSFVLYASVFSFMPHLGKNEIKSTILLFSLIFCSSF